MRLVYAKGKRMRMRFVWYEGTSVKPLNCRFTLSLSSENLDWGTSLFSLRLRQGHCVNLQVGWLGEAAGRLGEDAGRA